jgi:hypothetical protein
VLHKDFQMKKKIRKKKIPGKKNKIPGNEKKFRFLGIFMNIPSFNKFRRNIPAKKVEKFRRNFRKFRAGIPSFSDSRQFILKIIYNYKKLTPLKFILFS